MVTFETYVAVVGVSITILGIVWKAARYRERAEMREQELNELESSVERVEEKMADEQDVAGIQSELQTIKATMVELHEDHAALRKLYLNREGDRPFVRGGGSESDVEQSGKWRNSQNTDD